MAYVTAAQQEALRMVYPFMPLSLNPAEAGANGVISVTGIYRKKAFNSAVWDVELVPTIFFVW